jgi:hypothetical protein
MSSSRHFATADMDVVEVTPLAGLGFPRWPARPAHLSGAVGHPARVAERAAQQELDLGVGTAQLVGGPTGQGVVHGRIEP